MCFSVSSLLRYHRHGHHGLLVRIGGWNTRDDGDGCVMTHSLLLVLCGGWFWQEEEDDGLGRSAVESRNGFHFGRLDTNAHLGGCVLCQLSTIRIPKEQSDVGARNKARNKALTIGIFLT